MVKVSGKDATWSGETQQNHPTAWENDYNMEMLVRNLWDRSRSPLAGINFPLILRAWTEELQGLRSSRDGS
jgi:hypothetical protein